MSKTKKSKSKKAIPKKHPGLWILGSVLLAGILVLGGKYLIQDNAVERPSVVVPVFSPQGELGQMAFQTHCVVCHGENAAGSKNGPPLIDQIYRPAHHGNFSFVRAVTLGVPQHHWFFGKMVPLPQVTRGEIDQIIIYIRELQRANGIH